MEIKIEVNEQAVIEAANDDLLAWLEQKGASFEMEDEIVRGRWNGLPIAGTLDPEPDVWTVLVPVGMVRQ